MTGTGVEPLRKIDGQHATFLHKERQDPPLPKVIINGGVSAPIRGSLATQVGPGTAVKQPCEDPWKGQPCPAPAQLLEDPIRIGQLNSCHVQPVEATYLPLSS